MKKGKFGFLLLTFLVSVLSLCSHAQSNQPIVQETSSDKLSKEDSLNNLPDSLNDKNVSNLVADKLDSLVNTWYVKNAFKVDTLKYSAVSDSINNALPDSVYISRLKNLDSYISLPFNETVKKIIAFYTRKHPTQVSIMMGLSNYYFPLFEEILAKYNLPLELKYLPIIESALNPKAISRVRASGLWQFMYGTAKLYGLEINSFVDERFDPIKSTEAACCYLRDLFDIYGDWHVVLAAYNFGPGNINKAIRRSGGEQNYWEIYNKLPRETRSYIPTFIGATYVMNYAKEYQLSPIEPSFKIQTDTVELHAYYNFEQISANLNIPIEELRQLNPQYKRDIIPAKSDKPYILKLPVDKVSGFIDKQAQIYAYKRDRFFPDNQIIIPKGSLAEGDIEGKKKLIYTVKAGDSPSSIAKKHHISLDNLRSWNDIRKNFIKVGQKLAIYVPQNTSAKTKQLAASIANTKPNGTSPDSLSVASSQPDKNQQVSSHGNPDEFTYYTVRSGDSLYTIAKQFNGVSDVDIMAVNQIKDANNLMPGQKLKIPKKGEGI